jgi:hypothetical protein
MKRTFVAIALAAGLASPAFADVTVKQTTTGKGLGMSGTTTGTVYIKGNKMRADTVAGRAGPSRSPGRMRRGTR